MFTTMDGSFNIEELIVNGVRSRKKNTELPNCPVCSCTIRPGELEAHLAVEVDRLTKLNVGSKRKLSCSGAGTSRSHSAGPSTEMEDEVDVTGCTGGDIYQRVKSNRLRRLRSRRAPAGDCPVCGLRMPQARLLRHAVRCLRRSGAPPLDGEYVPDTSSDEDASIDVENDAEVSAGGTGFGAEYRWCGEWRVRAAALAGPRSLDATQLRRTSQDAQLVVDGDEDTELYGPPQYSPSRINCENETSQTERPVEETSMDRPISNGVEELTPAAETPQPHINGKNLVQASCETRILALTERIRELESKQQASNENKCLICLSAYTSPAVSIQCWHVYCEDCWIESLRAKKLCPQCNAITTACHLRRIFM